MRYHPPPNWPPPPSPDWEPPQNWGPDPDWGPPPDGWEFWIEDAPQSAAEHPVEEPEAPETTQIPTTAIRAATAYSEVTPAPGPPIQDTTDGWQTPPVAHSEPNHDAPGFEYRPPEHGQHATPSPNVGKTHRSSTIRSLTHPVWIASAALVVIAGLVFAYLQLRSGDAAAPGRLAFTAVTLQNPEPISAVGYDAANPANTTPVSDQTVTPIDITIENTGGTAAHISSITADVLVGENVGCGPHSDERRIAADYSLTIPYTVGGTVAKNTTAPLEVTVEPGSTERARVTVGLSEETTEPFALAVKLTVIPDSGAPMEIEPMGLINTRGVDAELRAIETMSASAAFQQCVIEQQRTIEDIYAATKVQSPVLDRLRDAYAQVIA